MTDIEIAKQVNLENILDIAKKTNIDENDVELINCMKVTDVIGLNFEEDSLDAGTHLNESGGRKVSQYIAEYLKENVLK